MKKKYYYKDILIRTSNNDYNFALIIENENGSVCIFRCSETYQGCEKELNRICKLYDSLLKEGISYDEWVKRQKERYAYYNNNRKPMENNDFDNMISKIIRKYNIWSDQYHDRRKLQIVKVEAR